MYIYHFAKKLTFLSKTFALQSLISFWISTFAFHDVFTLMALVANRVLQPLKSS